MPWIARCCLLATAITALLSPATAAQSVVGIAELTDASALVVTGRVIGVSSQWDPSVNGIYTYVQVDVAEVWKGELAARRIVLKLLGGRVGNLALEIHGQARLEPGTDVALWLEVRPRDGTLYPAALSLGVRELSDPMAVESWRASVLSRPAVTTSQPFVVIPPEWQPGVVSSFTFGPPEEEGGPARWHEADSDTVVFVDYQAPTGYGGGVPEIDAAIVLWNNSGMRLRMLRGNQRGTRCLFSYENGGDGRITLSFNDPPECAEVPDDGMTVGLGGGYFTDGELRTVGGTTFKKFLQGAVMLNPVSTAPSLAHRGCFQDAITHNLGHAIGLGHSTVPGAMMWPTPLAGCVSGPSPLADDDRFGARAIYPGPPGPPTNLAGAATGTTVTLSWSAPALGPVTTYIVEAGFAPGQPILSVPTGSTVTGATFHDVPAGFYYVRVRAQNSVGIGPVSNEIGLAVACDPPQPPTNLSFTAAANNVTFNWTPPPVGPPPLAYLLSVGDAPGAANLLQYQFPLAASLTATGIPGTFFVRLHALGSCGQSPASNEVVVTLPAPCVTPTAPQNFTHSVAANRVVSLSWSPPSTGSAPLIYTLEVGSQSGLSDLLVTSVGAVTALSVPAPQGRYFVRIRAVTPCGTSGPPSVERQIDVP